VDNLTHSLIGAAIGQTGLKKLSGLGMATLIIAANIPDIDAACFLWLEGHEHLAFRRGITHGPPAMLLLPALLTAAMVWFDQWQTRRGTRPDTRLPVRPLQLYFLALIGCLSHPAFDWLNNYGVRLLEPFSSQWFYGDTLFIIDVWLWAILIGGWFWSRRAESSGGNWRRRGQVVATVVGLYVFANGVITGRAEHLTAEQFRSSGETKLIVASPVPFLFWQRDVFIRGESIASSAEYLPGFGVELTEGSSGQHFADSGYFRCWLHQRAQHDRELAAYLYWTRMPIVAFEPVEDGFDITVSDQRYADPRVANRFTIERHASAADECREP
jgi:inner membrane protein